VPARGVSGDFYDFFELDDGRIGFSLGDVSGKGMNAALLMAKTISLYRCLGKSKMSPGELLVRVNEELCETGTLGMFVTMVGGIYDPGTDTVTFANAGHEPPLLRSADGQYTSFPAAAPPVGIATDLLPPGGFVIEEVQLQGGGFFVFTDGITESPLESGEMLGADGLRAALDELASRSPRERLAEIAARLVRSGVALHDDLTLLAIESAECVGAEAC
jgi:sigma-B regulation protein RsbU (phosphoserine phosphatase)